jgi:hypothetical protein
MGVRMHEIVGDASLTNHDDVRGSQPMMLGMRATAARQLFFPPNPSPRLFVISLLFQARAARPGSDKTRPTDWRCCHFARIPRAGRSSAGRGLILRAHPDVCAGPASLSIGFRMLDEVKLRGEVTAPRQLFLAQDALEAHRALFGFLGLGHLVDRPAFASYLHHLPNMRPGRPESHSV